MVGEELVHGTLMVNKESPVNATDENGGDAGNALGSGLSSQAYKSVPLGYKSTIPAYVDKVMITSNESEHFIVKVMSCNVM